jgi:hypothetical protein
LQILLENQLQCLVVAREGGLAIVGADHALRHAQFGAIGAQRAPAVSANGDGLRVVRGAFHLVWLTE